MNNVFEGAPLDTPIYMISKSHRLYVGTVIKVDGEIHRGKCLKGPIRDATADDNREAFYREGFEGWAWIE